MNRRTKNRRGGVGRAVAKVTRQVFKGVLNSEFERMFRGRGTRFATREEDNRRSRRHAYPQLHLLELPRQVQQSRSSRSSQ